MGFSRCVRSCIVEELSVAAWRAVDSFSIEDGLSQVDTIYIPWTTLEIRFLMKIYRPI